MDIIDYSTICISIHISKINELESILKNITEEQYDNMWYNYDKVKHLFTLGGMTQQIINSIN